MPTLFYHPKNIQIIELYTFLNFFLFCNYSIQFLFSYPNLFCPITKPLLFMVTDIISLNYLFHYFFINLLICSIKIHSEITILIILFKPYMKKQLSSTHPNESTNSRLHSPQRPLSPQKILSLESQVSPFYTQIKNIPEQQVQLQKYIAGLHKQIKDAVWKQQLILQYNYMPLQSIKEKIDFEKQSYQNRMDAFREEYRKMFENSQFTTELENLRSFNIKLKQKMKQFELKIQQINVKNAITKADADIKRQKLKQSIKVNMDLSKNYVQRLGATNKQDIIRLVKAKSQHQLQKRSSLQSLKLNQSKKSLIQRSQSAKTTKPYLRKSLFEQCLNKLIYEVKLMNTSEDIQSGIYLEVMDRKRKELTTKGKMSHRSSISNTLHQRYAGKIHKKDNKHFEENDFEMDFDTFRDLNWKQLLGIMLVKDPDCQKLKNQFKKMDFRQFC